MADIGVHVLDTLLWWTGDVARIRYADDNMGGVEADCEMQLDMVSGAAGYVELSRTRDLSNRCYLKGEKGPQEQIDALEKARQQINAKGNTPPPGFHAQLGMLYANVGNDTNAMQEFDAEKQLFPEAATYMDFLMKKPKQQ